MFKTSSTSTPIRSAKTAFTLIELLVVIAIIAILAAILFPVFARARENARRSSCQSNLKQIGLGFLQYVQDYDERFPGFTSTGNTTDPAQNWAIGIQPYIKSTQLMVCPSVSGQQGGAYTYNVYVARMNRTGLACSQVDANNLSRHISTLAESTKTPLVLEARGIPDEPTNLNDIRALVFFAQNSGGFGVGFGRATPAPFISGTTTYLSGAAGAGGDAIGNRHLDGTNYLFADGHVKWLVSPEPTGDVRRIRTFDMDYCPGGPLGTATQPDQ